jgi:type I restriction enzyme S subunit
MSVQKLITQHLDIWVSACDTKSGVGRGNRKRNDFYGIKRLRELILELAVCGKLVPQDISDEPVSILLEKIAKLRLERNGKLKGTSSIVEINERLFDSPATWQWVSLGEVVDIVRGITFPSSEKSTSPENGRVACLRTTNVQNTIEWDDLLYIREEFVSREDQFIQFQDVVMSMANSRELVGKVALIDAEPEQKSTFGGFLSVIRPQIILPKFLMLYFRTPKVKETLIGSASQTTNIANISLAKLNPLPFVVPPLAEQHRIVAKVDELMAFCDQLEQTQSDNIAAHAQLVEALLATLTNSNDHNELQNNWQRIAAHFDTLFTTEHSIDQLKQTILQLAVMGKLVPQNSNDEPASELLKKITAEKAQLIKEGKIKNHPPVEPMGDQIFLPDGWIEVVVQDFADVRLGSTPSRTETKYWDGDILWVSSGEVANCIITDTAEKITKEGFANSSTSMIPARSLLMAIIGQGKTRGQTALLGVEACTNQNVAAFVFNENFVVPEFIWLWARSKYESHRGDGRGGAQPALNGKIVRSFRFPLPPFEEQQRIVAKVDELMDLCDALQTNLQNVQTTQLALADALVEQVVL